jgi:hypothetical protein
MTQQMNQRTNGMDDRFDRRELLLHLGDMLDAASRLAKGSALDTAVSSRVQNDASLSGFWFLPTLAAKMTVAEFSADVADAFSQWPRELLEVELNRDALALAVQASLFGDNAEGWSAYVGHMQKQVTWFGAGLPEVEEDVSVEVVAVEPPAEVDPPDEANEKRGWPWPEPRSTH